MGELDYSVELLWEGTMSEDVYFKYDRCENCNGLIVLGMSTKLNDEGKILHFCGDGCLSAWLVDQ